MVGVEDLLVGKSNRAGVDIHVGGGKGKTFASVCGVGSGYGTNASNKASCVKIAAHRVVRDNDVVMLVQRGGNETG